MSPFRPPFRRFAAGAVLVWGGASAAAVVAALAHLRIDRGVTLESGTANAEALAPLWWAWTSGWLSLAALWWMSRRTCPFTSLLGGPARSTWIILAVALAARLLILLTHQPALSDDVYRYALDGRHLASGTNPYLVAPRDSPWRELAAPVNNPELHTIYLPASQWTFGAVAAMLPSATSPAAASRAFRAAMIAAETIAIALLLLLLHRCGRSPWTAAFYAWHPLALCEIAGSGHQEALGLPLLLGAALLWSLRPQRPWLWSAPLAAATLVKPVVLPVAILMLRGRPWRAWLAAASSGALVCALLAAPLLAADAGRPLRHLLDTASRFSLKWAHFGALYELVLATIERLAPGWGNDPQERLARLLCAAALLASLIIILRRARSLPGGAAAMVLAMALCSPAAHPWYLLWGLVLLPLTFNPALWIASLTLAWGYAAFAWLQRPDGTLAWGVPSWLLAAAHAPILAALLCQALRPGPGEAGYHGPLPLAPREIT
jgi:alpha-1,6-mannosyltransferase